MGDREPYYRRPLALVHHLGFAAHAHPCAPGILELLAPLRERGSLVVELGCRSGHDNVLIDVARVPELVAVHGVAAGVRSSFGREDLPTGLRAVVGGRPA
jgi:hypothetical protein